MALTDFTVPPSFLQARSGTLCGLSIDGSNGCQVDDRNLFQDALCLQQQVTLCYLQILSSMLVQMLVHAAAAPN